MVNRSFLTKTKIYTEKTGFITYQGVWKWLIETKQNICLTSFNHRKKYRENIFIKYLMYVLQEEFKISLNVGSLFHTSLICVW